MNGLPESLLRLRGALADASGRGRRARADARENAERFRSHAGEVAGDEGSDEPRPDGLRERAAQFRTAAGLPMPAIPEDGAKAAESRPESQEQTPSDGSDLDFSQAQIMR